ncbi:hypothetical protein M0802_010396 [Mischocyttarus mexicanus]|nr:hypothetical protein M0802_010396 [Mischocyttarus mexicanus]
MGSIMIVTIVTCILTYNFGFTNSAKILVIMPSPSYSHQIAYHSIWRNLSLRGHEVTLVTSDPLPDKNLTNFRQIDISMGYKYLKTLNFLEKRNTHSWINILEDYIFKIACTLIVNIFDHPDLKKIYAPDSNEKFDLVMVEALWTPSFYAFGHRFKAPLIGMISLGLTETIHYTVGNPMIPSHPSSYEINVGNGFNVPFWKRVQNYILSWWYIHVISYYQMYKAQQEIAERYFGNIPSLIELEKNMSIVFMNQQDELSFTRPYVSKVIKISGLHLTNKITSEPLPKKLKQFMDNASKGFIYVSLGTNVHTSMFSKELLDIFFDVLSNFPMKVVWKFQGDISKIPDNIYVAPWFSQQKILAHPNLKLFVYQGGLQSTEEAVHFGVPLVGIPVLGDQDMQVSKMKDLGVCRSVEMLQLTRESLNSAIMDVLNNKSYKENMLKLSKFIKDKPYDPMEKVIWWIEYIIRHKGAPHLRCNIVDEPWYQRYNTDVIAFLSVTLFIIIFLTMYITYKVFVFIIKYYITSMKKEKNKKKKKN